MTASELQASRMKGRPDVVSSTDVPSPPELEVDPKFEVAFRQQVDNINRFNEQMRAWWTTFLIQQTKE